MSDFYVQIERKHAHAVLHALSQPLTVMSLGLTLAQSAESEAERTMALQAVASECERAMRSMQQLRSLLDDGVELQRPVVAGETGDTSPRSFGGMA